MAEAVTLLSNAAATGASSYWRGGRGMFAAAGTFNGATVKLQFLGPDGSTWIDAGTNTTLTAAGGGIFDIPPSQIRGAVSGGPPSGMYATAARVNP